MSTVGSPGIATMSARRPASSTDFFLHAEVDGYESGQRTYSDTWNLTIPRDHL